MTTSAELDKTIVNNNKGVTVLMVAAMEHLHFVKRLSEKVCYKDLILLKFLIMLLYSLRFIYSN